MSWSSASSRGGDHEAATVESYKNGNGGIEDEEEISNDEERYFGNGDHYDIDLEKSAQSKRRHRKALDIKNNGLSTDGLQIMLDRYDTNVRFIESIQTGTTPDRALIAEMQGQTASQIYTRCSKRDTFTETHVGDDIMATFSTIRDYRGSCDMQRMDPNRFQQVFDQFAAWDEHQYEEFKRNYTLEYVFRRILQRDTIYRDKYTRLLKQCQESTDYSTISRPLLPLPTPKFLTGDSQLELCNSSLRSKLRNLRQRKVRGALDETSPESMAFLARLNAAVNSFFRRLDFVEESNWPMSMSSVKKVSDDTITKMEANGKRKRPLSTVLPSMVCNDNKTAAALSANRTANGRVATQVNTLARAVLRKAFRGAVRSQQAKLPNIKKPLPELIPPPSFPTHIPNFINGYHTPQESQLASEPPADTGITFGQRRPSLLASKRPSSYITRPSTMSSSRYSINNISAMIMKKAKIEPIAENLYPTLIPDFRDDQSVSTPTNGYNHANEQVQDQPLSLLGVGVDEPIDEEDLKSILNDLAGMHAVVNCEDFGRVIEHGSVQHPHWGTILVRRGRVVRLGSAQSGFQAPDPRMEFQFPMEQLSDFVPSDKIRFDDERNLYLNGVLTDFYFLQC